VSHSPAELAWRNSVVVTGNVAEEIKKLKSMDAPEVTVGGGKRLFAEGTRPAGFKLTDCKSATTGVIVATFERAGPLQTSSIHG
jgi:hypothetical protein